MVIVVGIGNVDDASDGDDFDVDGNAAGHFVSFLLKFDGRFLPHRAQSRPLSS